MATSQDDSQPSQDSVMTATQEDRHEILYFAYGSNISTSQMLRRCPFSTPVGLGRLDGWRWLVNRRGFANIVPDAAEQGGGGSSRSVVWGLLYLLPPRDEAQLDMHEGVPWAYQKVHVDVRWVRRQRLTMEEEERRQQQQEEVQEDVQMVRALVYVDWENTEEGVVRDEYVDRLERAIEEAVDDWGFDEAYADRVMRRHWR